MGALNHDAGQTTVEVHSKLKRPFSPTRLLAKLTFLNRVFPLAGAYIQAPRFRCSLTECLWIMVAQMFGIIIPLSFAITLLTPIYVIAIAVVGMNPTVADPADALDAQKTILTLLGTWVGLVLCSTIALIPIFSRSFGYRMRNILLRFWSFPDSVAKLFSEMRWTLMIFIACQAITAFTAFFLLDSKALDWGPLSDWNPVLILACVFFTFGGLIFLFGNIAFLNSRGRRIKCWMSACWRGVALRNFIPEWDNKLRPIFDSCRTSRRLGRAYRSVKMGSASCFGAGGCLAATTIGESYLGLGAMAIAVCAMPAVWPTANRIVNWTSSIMDPITGKN